MAKEITHGEIFFFKSSDIEIKIGIVNVKANGRTETSFNTPFCSCFQYLNVSRRYESLSSICPPPTNGAKGFSLSLELYSRMKLYLADDIYDFQSYETLPTFILSLAELRFWRCYHHPVRFPFHRLVPFDLFVSTVEKTLPTIWKAHLNGIKVIHGLP